MRHNGGDRADARVALPPGWVEVDPADATGSVGGRMVQLATVARWDGAAGLRPTLSVTVTPPTTRHIAVRVLDEAESNLDDVHVVAIDPWAVPGTTATGRRLVLAHLEGDSTVTSLVWVTTTAIGEVVVSAHVESTDLHVHDPAFAAAVDGIRLPPGHLNEESPHADDLVRRARVAPWTDLVPPTDAARAPIMADPDARILVEASVAGANLRFDATLVRDEAAISATISPRRLAHRPAAAGDAPAQAGVETTTFRVPATRVALAVARWLGLGPAWTAPPAR
jgi:hypothetical protein